jgi:uncharacterized protein YgiM (DUF1202 family)
MKTNWWLVFGAMLASSAIAQNNTNTLPDMPAPASLPAAAITPAPTNARPAARAARPARMTRRTAPRAATTVSARPEATAKEPESVLLPGPAQVTVSNLVVRGQAGLKGEVIAHVFKGESVTVLSEITLDKNKAGEPAHWAKITYPTNTPVWVSAKYVDAKNNAVLANKLNLRAGPGENFSVVGVIERGATVNSLSTKNGWMKIEAPANAYAFVAAMYLKQTASAPAEVAAVTPTPAPNPVPDMTPVPESQPIVTTPPAPPAETTPSPAPPPGTYALGSLPLRSVEPQTTEPAVNPNTPPPVRIVSHEGVVRHVSSPITPTAYELYDPRTDVNIDFLYTTATNLDLGRYIGMRIIVTGQEELAARWTDTPVLTVEKINVLDTNAVPRVIYRSPRQSQRY